MRVPLSILVLLLLSTARVDTVLLVSVVGAIIVLFVLMDYQIQSLQERLDLLQERTGTR